MRGGLISATADLTWFFERGVLLEGRSPHGGMAERFHYVVRRPGWRDAVDVWPRHEQHESSRVEPDMAESERHGRVSRKLKSVALEDARAARALAAAFGVQGAKWARHERGRNVALFPLTDPGQALVLRAKRLALKTALDLSDAERLYVEVEIDRIQNGRDALRRRLITMAMVESAELLAGALELWVRMR